MLAPESAELLANVIERDRIWLSGLPKQYFMTEAEAKRVATMLRKAAKDTRDAFAAIQTPE